MAFFMATKGILHPYHFRYLDGDFEHARLEPTLISDKSKKMAAPKHESKKVDFYAIDVMKSPVKVLNQKSTLDEVRNLMKEKGIRHIPIIDDHKFLGIISDRDLLKMDLSGTFSFLKAADIMNTVVVVTHEETPLAHIARVMLEEKISALPVVNEQHRLTGIITRSDILEVVIYNRLVLK